MLIKNDGKFFIKRIIFCNAVSGRSHCLNDIVSDSVFPDISKSACKPSGYCAVSAFKKPV